ncbi:MAG: disk-shape morphogenesis protein volactin [Planctomycetota bacterium]
MVGSPAFELANVFNRETRRPMAAGLISPHEVDALPIIRLLIRQVLGGPAREGELCFYSVPGEPIDSNMNVVYHRDIFDGLLKKLDFTPESMAEAHALVFAELADDDFTGIAISCGAGMFNICVAYKTMPAVVFSTSRGGDWIDTNAAAVLGMKGPRVTAIKEKGVDLMNPTNREEEAIIIYYRNLINYTLTNIKNRFESADSMPTFPSAVDIVCAGGTSLATGFIDLFAEEFKKVDFPLEAKNIRLAGEPLNAIAQGCLVAGVSGME